MADDLYAAAEQARQQSDAFMNRSREQMMAAFASQRAMAVGSPPGAAPAGATGGVGGAAMLAGSPAGRLLDTINSLIRRGVGIGGAAIGGPVSTAAGGMGAFGGMAGGAASFMMGNQSFGPAGMGSGAMMGQQNRMNTWQMLFTAFGRDYMPFGLGRYAAQRMDMTDRQAQEMAREETMYRLSGGARRGIQAGWSIASFGLSNFMMRRHGLELDYFRKEDFNRSFQENMRFMTQESLQKAGLSQYRGAFPTGISRRGADVIGAGLRRELGDIQRETGASAEQLIAIQGRAMGTMGALGLNRAMSGGVENFNFEVGQQVRNIREIQQTLNLSEEEADQFFRSMGQMYGTANRIAEMARTARRSAGRMGMDVRDVFGIMRQFEDTGRQMMIGQAATGQTGLRMAERFRGWQQSGILNREEAMMYGGRTYEEGLQIMTQRAFQMGVGQFEQGRLGGMGLMMRYDQANFNRFMGGGMGALEAAGAVGGMVAQDPLMRLRARYDERIRRQSGQEGLRTQYMRVQAMQREGQFMFGGTDEEMFQAFERNTGMAPMEAKRWFKFFDREKRAIQMRIQGMPNYADMSEGERKQHEQKILQLHQRLRSEGGIELARELTGKNEYDAVGQIYEEAQRSGLDLESTPVQQLLRKTFTTQERRISEARAGNVVDVATGAARIGIARTNLGIQMRGDAFQRGKFFGGRDVAAIGTLFKEAGLTRGDIYRELLTRETGRTATGEAIREGVRATMSFLPEEWEAKGFGAGLGDWRSRGIGPQEAVAYLREEGTDVARNIFAVEAMGTTKKMSIEEIQKYFPELAAGIMKNLQENTKGLDNATGLQGFIRRRANSSQMEKRFQEAQNKMAMAKYGGAASYVFGRRGAGFKFEDFVQNMRNMAAGRGQGDVGAYEQLVNRMGPDFSLFMEAMAMPEEGVGVNVEALRAYFGDDLANVLETVTGRDAAAIKEDITRGGKMALNKMFDKSTVNGLFRYVLEQQGEEALVLGSATKPTYMQMTKEGLTSLQEAFKNALIEAGLGNK